MSAMTTYTAVYVEDDGGYACWIEEIPGAISQGDTLDEARENLRDALTLLLEVNRENAQELAAGRKVIREPLSPGSHRPAFVKRSDLVGHLHRHDCVLVREGGSHTFYRNPANGKQTAVPRHRDIKEVTAPRLRYYDGFVNGQPRYRVVTPSSTPY